MAAPELWLITYDVTCDRVRYRIDRLLTAYGTRFQKSVFTCRLTPAGLRALRASVETLIDPESDSLRAYPLCTWCEADAARSGLPMAPPVPSHWII